MKEALKVRNYLKGEIGHREVEQSPSLLHCCVRLIKREGCHCPEVFDLRYRVMVVYFIYRIENTFKSTAIQMEVSWDTIVLVRVV